MAEETRMQNIFHAKKVTSEDHPPPLVHLILSKLTVAIQEIPVLSDPEKMPATASPGNPWTKMIIDQQISFKEDVSHHPLSTYLVVSHLLQIPGTLDILSTM